MYVSTSSHIEPRHVTHRVANEDFEVHWEGLLFLPRIRAGLVSAQSLLEVLQPDDNTEALAKRVLPLRGNWVLFIHALKDDSWMICADHSHQSHLYYSGTAVSSSFLRMLEDVDDRSAFSDQALGGFLCTGFCMQSNAFYEGLNTLDYRDYICIRNGRLSAESKGLPDALERGRDCGRFLDTLDSLFSSLRDERMCVDLTGGTDSRLLVTCLQHLGYDFDAATEGDDAYSEVKIAQAVAGVLGKKLMHRSLAADDLHPSDLHDAWLASDGLDLPMLSYKFESWRQRLGYSVAVSGFGGELYKDGGWYRAALASAPSRNPTANLVDRMMTSGLLTWDATPLSDVLSMLTPEMGARVREWMAEIHAQLSAEYGMYPLIQASDRLFYGFNINRPSGIRIPDMPHYTPLTEPDLVRIGVNQPLMRRMNHRFHRKEVAGLNSSVAALPTDRGGLTMSARLADQPREWCRYFQYHAASMGIGRTREYKSENRNKSVVDKFVLESDDLREAMVTLKDRGVLNPTFDRPTVTQAKRLLMLHYLRGQTGTHPSTRPRESRPVHYESR